MAEGFTRHLKGDEIEAHSAGVAPKGVEPRAVRAMAEAGVDISGQRSKSVDHIRGQGMKFDYVITLCDNAQKTCPSFPAQTRVIHMAFDDPPRLAEGARDEEEAMRHYRRVRDEIRAFVKQLPESLLDEVRKESLRQQETLQAGVKAFLEHLPDSMRADEEKE
jgi:arsenate reductase